MNTAEPSTSISLRELFDRLVDSAPGTHAAILREARASAEDVRKLHSWLAADAGTSPLDAPATMLSSATDDADLAQSLLGRHAGPYRLVAVLGRGGSSIVFRAERALGDSLQVVALKLLQNGLYSQESRRRFRREQAILMQLSHPNIARLMDAGLTDAGVPYIAMEEVDGKDLLTHAQANALGCAQRLRLLVEMCRAIDSAHRALIVHRDIKPSNVLVTREGHVKVLDFGIAKVVGDDASRTATQHIVLTPDYAAPEQFAPGLLTTAADVYALGVLAGELLAGVRVEPDAGMPAEASIEARRRWSALDRDLVNILRTATAFEPDRRYVSAGHLADDLDRFLERKPVSAHPQSAWYRARKFVARHRALVALSAAFCAFMLLSTGFALYQAIAAGKASARAALEASRANAMRDFVFDAFSEAEPVRPHGKPVTIPELVDRATAKIRAQTTMDPHARLELRTKLAEVVGSQGDLERSGALLSQVRDDAIAAFGRDDQLTREVERSLERNLYFRGKYAQARAAADGLLALVDPASRLGAVVLRDSASIAVQLHNPEQAVRDAGRAVQTSDRLGDTELLRETLKTQGSALLASGDLAGARAVFERELQLSRQDFGDESDQASAALSGLSRANRRLGDMVSAERQARQALTIDRKIYPGDHWIVANHLNALGMVLLEQRKLDDARTAFDESLRIQEKTLGSDHPDVAISLKDVAAVHLAKEDFATALPLLARALAISVANPGEHSRQTAIIRTDYGFARAMLDEDPTIGAGALDRAIAELRVLAASDPEALGRALEKRIRVSLAHGDIAGASRLLHDFAQTAAGANAEAAYWAGRADCLEGEVRLRAGESREALRAIEKCGSSLRQAQRPDRLLKAEQPLLLALAHAGSDDSLSTDSALQAAREQLDQLPFPPRRLQQWYARLTH